MSHLLWQAAYYLGIALIALGLWRVLTNEVHRRRLRRYCARAARELPDPEEVAGAILRSAGEGDRHARHLLLVAEHILHQRNKAISKWADGIAELGATLVEQAKAEGGDR